MGGFQVWLSAVAATILAGIVVPYGLLGGGQPATDIFVFWCVFGLGVIVLIGVGLSGWRR
ncbi:hypothetical protein SAMN04490244_102212 [Tranquillimonas rosea]|uniref:Uncharacterized protein n=1 Tax=Tranquillimonas rosea TaxID=641238 RepID=A0A1H9RCJ9_9RHOB|nr:hypothetical protein [Tranquillimonas rosea]SER70388.1 hypothetical protein SAMN04490244_102212 [Tranquillimonas rosea]